MKSLILLFFLCKVPIAKLPLTVVSNQSTDRLEEERVTPQMNTFLASIELTDEELGTVTGSCGWGGWGGWGGCGGWGGGWGGWGGGWGGWGGGWGGWGGGWC
jgi:hypothetical protein